MGLHPSWIIQSFPLPIHHPAHLYNLLLLYGIDRNIFWKLVLCCICVYLMLNSWHTTKYNTLCICSWIEVVVDFFWRTLYIFVKLCFFLVDFYCAIYAAVFNFSVHSLWMCVCVCLPDAASKKIGLQNMASYMGNDARNLYDSVSCPKILCDNRHSWTIVMNQTAQNL